MDEDDSDNFFDWIFMQILNSLCIYKYRRKLKIDISIKYQLFFTVGKKADL